VTRRALQSVIHNFVETFTSRYSEFDRYWLFGYLVQEHLHLQLSLLIRPPATGQFDPPNTIAQRLAFESFWDQVNKAGVKFEHIREAGVTIEAMPGVVEGTVNDRPCEGRQLLVSAIAVTDLGRVYQARKMFFVAPHNPQLEFQSNPK
jgi:hypothetical protein